MNYKVNDFGVTVGRINDWVGLAGSVYTRETYTAIREFQERSGLPQTGAVDATTWAKLVTHVAAFGSASEGSSSAGNAGQGAAPTPNKGDSNMSGKLRLSESGKQHLFAAEGFRSRPYLDSAGVPTIGYGNTHYADGTRVRMSDSPLTRDEAERLFELIRHQYEQPVQQIIATLTQNQFDALVSFVYNLGAGAFNGSTLRKKVIANPNDPAIRAEFMKWVNAGGKRIQGLVNRRAAEANLYFKRD